MSYLFLIGEMAKRRITKQSIANTLDLHRNAVAYKLKKGSFSIEEAELVQQTYFPDISLKTLFQKE